MKFRKANLRLRESEDTSAENKLNDVAKQAEQNPSHKAQAPLSDFNNNEADTTPKITVDNDNPQSKQFVKTLANNPNIVKSNPTVEFTENVKRKPILEGINFTKGELSSFLRGL